MGFPDNSDLLAHTGAGKCSPSIDIPGLTQQRTGRGSHEEGDYVGPKLIIIMVGLPARGKSYITKKLARYLNWLQYETCIFNAGQNRRSISFPPADQPSASQAEQLNGSIVTSPVHVKSINSHPEIGGPRSPSKLRHPASFFDPRNQEAVSQREQIALHTLDQLLDWLIDGGGCVGIFDATNSTIERRKVVIDHIQARPGPSPEILFLESCCFDSALLEKNTQLKLSGPDYKDKDPKSALADFRRRVVLYEKSYVPLGPFEEEHSIPYLKLIDVGRKVIAYEINGFLSTQVVEYLMNFNLSERQIWITRNGESLDDAAGKIGRNSPLTRSGARFAVALARFIETQRHAWEGRRHPDKPSSVLRTLQSATPENCIGQHLLTDGPTKAPGVRVWTSMMTQAMQTAQFFDETRHEVKYLKMLDDLHAGKMEGLTFAEIQATYPEEMASRRKSKLNYRWPGPGGEGYVDVINRLRPVIIELERMRDPVLIITHRAVARVLLAYFQTLSRESLADINVPLGAIFCVEPVSSSRCLYLLA
jgi:6-phosphofructo-2-kinase